MTLAKAATQTRFRAIAPSSLSDTASHQCPSLVDDQAHVRLHLRKDMLTVARILD